MKSGIFKKILALSLVVLMILTAVFATGCAKKDDDKGGKSGDGKLDGSAGRKEFISSIGGVSETYKGAVSTESYATAEDAAEAFVVTELIGNNTATISNVSVKKELNESEAAAIIPTEILGEGVRGIQQLEVTYSLLNGSSMKAGNGYTNVDTLDTTRKVDVYVIKYELDWKYFSPMPVTNSTITKSYYDSVFGSDRYANCTFETTTDMKISVNAGGESQNVNCTITQTIKYADGKILLSQTVTGDDSGMLGLSNSNLQAYMEEVNGSMKIYIKQGTSSSWVEGNLYQMGFSKIEDLTPFANSYLDYTYFNKTDYGFALTGENAKKYFTTAFESMAGGLNDMFDQMDIDMFAEYYVKEGALSGARTEANVKMEMTVDGYTAKLDESVKAVTTCTNYGTTVVTKPF